MKVTTQSSHDAFVAALVYDPQDRQSREMAVSWYTVDAPDDARCAWHLSRLAAYHPQSLTLGIMGKRLFMIRPRFRQLIERRLLRHSRSNAPERGLVFLNLAYVASAGMRPDLGPVENEQKWRKYFGIPRRLDLGGSWDSEAGPRAIEYLKKALALPDLEEETRRLFVTVTVMAILDELHREDELIAFGRTMPRPAAPDALMSFGKALFKAGQWDEARVILQEAIAEDALGYEQGGHVSLQAHMHLATIEQKNNALFRAQEHLVAASKLTPCCHTTQDLIEALVDALVRVERPAIAVDYLRGVVKSGPDLAGVANEILARHGLSLAT